MFKREFCTTREAAEVLGVSLRTAQLWVDSGILDAWKTSGGHRRISVASVERLYRSSHGQPAGDEARAPLLPASLMRLKLLLVEDDVTLLKLYRALIVAWNLPVEVTTATNGYEALVLIGREQPDLLITDLNMPGIDGFMMVRTLINSSFREGMQIVAVTGLDDVDMAANGGLPPGIRVFRKPAPFLELRAIVEKMLAERQALLNGNHREPAD